MKERSHVGGGRGKRSQGKEGTMRGGGRGQEEVSRGGGHMWEEEGGGKRRSQGEEGGEEEGTMGGGRGKRKAQWEEGDKSFTCLDCRAQLHSNHSHAHHEFLGLLTDQPVT